MPQFHPRLIVDNDQDDFLNQTSFWSDNEIALFGYNSDNDAQTLNTLVFKVRRNPKNLLSHLRRIYFCYQKGLPTQLYAALLDLLIILQGKGKAFSRRMLYGSRRQLDQQSFQTLELAIHQNSNRQGNLYSLFTTGQIGKCELVKSHQTQAEHDFLVLANDFIEYSQLEQAMDVLETGVSLNPDRIDLQEALLELYKSTGNSARFDTSYKTFIASGVTLVEEWLLMAQYFEGQSR